MAEIKTKLELDDLLALMVTQFETLFATNDNKQLSAADLRQYMQTQIDYLTILNDSMKIQRGDFVILDGAAEAILQVDDNTSYIHTNGVSQTVDLPPLTAENAGLVVKGVITSANDVTFVPDGSDFIFGTNPIADSLYSITSTVKGWAIEFKALV